MIPLGVFLIFVRIAFTATFLFYYFGIREESIDPKKARPKKEVKIEGSLFRISKKPAVITEEEVIFHKEKKICLVCKGKVLGLTYICPECDALYCVKCSEGLSNAENACWVCNHPFEQTKPSKPFKLVEDKQDIEVLDKEEKTNKQYSGFKS